MATGATPPHGQQEQQQQQQLRPQQEIARHVFTVYEFIHPSQQTLADPSLLQLNTTGSTIPPDTVVIHKTPGTELGLKCKANQHGLVVTSVKPGKPAAAKLRAGDMITTVNGQVASAETAMSVLQSTINDDIVLFTVKHNAVNVSDAGPPSPAAPQPHLAPLPPGDVEEIELHRPSNEQSWGLKLRGGVDTDEDQRVTMNVVPNSVASANPRLWSNDQLLAINRQSVHGLTHNQVVQLLSGAPSPVLLSVRHSMGPLQSPAPKNPASQLPSQPAGQPAGQPSSQPASRQPTSSSARLPKRRASAQRTVLAHTGATADGKRHKRIEDVVIHKDPSQSLGLSILGGYDHPEGLPSQGYGIFVLGVTPDGAAMLDGRIKPGDQVLLVNGEAIDHLDHATVVERFRAAASEGQISLRVKHAKRPGAVINKQQKWEARVVSITPADGSLGMQILGGANAPMAEDGCIMLSLAGAKAPAHPAVQAGDKLISINDVRLLDHTREEGTQILKDMAATGAPVKLVLLRKKSKKG